jgi:N-acetylmuramoyl-L-alanine amidase
MVKRIMIDAGMNTRRSCAGKLLTTPSQPYQIGRELTDQLDGMGYETLFSGDSEELSGACCGTGRPSVCASVAKRWHADCVIRLAVSASAHPSEGTVSASVFKRDERSRQMAETVLRIVDRESALRTRELRCTSGILLLRRTSVPSMILVLELPFRQKEQLFASEAREYAAAIAGGIDTWARGIR